MRVNQKHDANFSGVGRLCLGHERNLGRGGVYLQCRRHVLLGVVIFGRAWFVGEVSFAVAYFGVPVRDFDFNVAVLSIPFLVFGIVAQFVGSRFISGCKGDSLLDFILIGIRFAAGLGGYLF